MDRARILQGLENDRTKARERRNRASTRFDEAVSGAASGIPYPDNTERLRNASKEYTLALEAVKDAPKKQNDFLIRGILPPDAKQSAGAT
jgi:hypothetical protein